MVGMLRVAPARPTPGDAAGNPTVVLPVNTKLKEWRIGIQGCSSSGFDRGAGGAPLLPV